MPESTGLAFTLAAFFNASMMPATNIMIALKAGFASDGMPMPALAGVVVLAVREPVGEK